MTHRHTQVKICGITRKEDALAAAQAGADYLGFILCAASPRYVPPERVRDLVTACPDSLRTVGVFVNTGPDDVCRILEDCGLNIAQLHGDETAADIAAIGAERVWKAVWLKDDDDLVDAMPVPAARLLADAAAGGRRGGTGRICRWDLAARLARQRPMILAGGLCPENVAEAVARVQPVAIDVGSGVEATPGHKDHERIHALFAALRHTSASQPPTQAEHGSQPINQSTNQPINQ